MLNSRRLFMKKSHFSDSQILAISKRTGTSYWLEAIVV